jgi:pimeloyl-ACP methyl ester carboxylesterase
MQATLKVGKESLSLDYALAPQMVVFSHGFGVRQDARGMFTDIVAALPKGWGYVLFNYDAFDDVTKSVTITGFAARVKKLQAVLEWVRQQTGVEKVHLVGHSIGALTIADLAPENVGSIVLIAPPLSLGLRFAERFTKREGAEHSGHTWRIPRSDGTITIADEEPLTELMNVEAEAVLAKLGFFRPYVMVLAGADEVLQDEDYTELIVMPTVNMTGIDGASHDFTGSVRQELVQTVIDQLQKGPSVKNMDDSE